MDNILYILFNDHLGYSLGSERSFEMAEQCKIFTSLYFINMKRKYKPSKYNIPSLLPRLLNDFEIL